MHSLGEHSLYPCFKSTLGFFVSYAADKVPFPKLLSERLVYLWRIRAKFNRKSFPFVSGCLQICKICWIILYIFLYTCLCHVHWVHVLVKCTAGRMVLQERIQNDRFGPNPFQKLWTPSWPQELEQHAEHHWRVESLPYPIPTPSLRSTQWFWMCGRQNKGSLTMTTSWPLEPRNMSPRNVGSFQMLTKARKQILSQSV